MLASQPQHKIGVLLVNLGTPSKPTAKAVRRYLGQFLHDHRVIELTRFIWCWILHGIILRIRPAIVAKKYASIWTPEGSPLLVISRHQVAKLQAHFEALSAQSAIKVKLAMRYGQPSIANGLSELLSSGVTRLLVLPVYPQYCAATTATVFDEVTRQLRHHRRIPEIRFINDYHDHPLYIRALADSVRYAWAEKPPAEKLLLSFHGIPKRYVNAGDPYYQQCQRTTELLADALSLDASRYQLVFQSRFGREEWLQPYCSQTLTELGKAGLGSVDMICPGFSVDCLETLEEIDVENRLEFTEAGGGEYRYIPALNDNEGQIALFQHLIVQHTQGW